MAFKADSDDIRDSLSYKLKKELAEHLLRLKKQLPSASKLAKKDLDRLISLVKTIKW